MSAGANYVAHHGTKSKLTRALAAMSPTGRLALIVTALNEAKLDAILCALPSHVLLLSGYWPVVGSAFALVTNKGACCIYAPEDEQELAEKGWATGIEHLPAPALDRLIPYQTRLAEALRHAVSRHSLWHSRIGVEQGHFVEPATYAAQHHFGSLFLQILNDLAPEVTLLPADSLLARLRSQLTETEVEYVRRACLIAGQAYEQIAEKIAPGLRETEIAAMGRFLLPTVESISRADGFIYCMSGPHSARAYGAYARSTPRVINAGELILVHCNSYLQGYWTDITRTFFLGTAGAQIRKMYSSLFDARQAAFESIRPGVLARDIDAAARDVLTRDGYGSAFRHPTGHGVGFAAIDHEAMPRLHPASKDRLQPGMVFNVEPGIYLDHGGMRHCDLVRVTESGFELLTPFLSHPDTLMR